MRDPQLSDLGIERRVLRLKSLHLSRQEFRRVRGAAGPIPKILVQDPRHQLVGDLRSHRSIAVFESDRENDRGIFHRGARPLLEVQLKVDRRDFRVLLDLRDELGRRHQRALVREQLEFVGDRDEIISRHRPLLNDLNTLLRSAGNRRPDQFGWNLLRLNEDPSFGKIGRRPQQSCRGARSQDRDERQHEIGPAPLEQFPIESGPQQVTAVLLQRLEIVLKFNFLQHVSSERLFASLLG